MGQLCNGLHKGNEAIHSLEACDGLGTKKQNVALQLHGCLSKNM